MRRSLLALVAVASFSFMPTSPAFAHGGGAAGGGGQGAGGQGAGGGAPLPGGGPIGGGANRGGSRDPVAPRGGLLDERRERNRRLRDLGSNPSAAGTPAPRPVTPAPLGGGAGDPAPAPTMPDTSLVHLHHGRVRMFAGLARVDLLLEVQNVGTEVLEWQRSYAIDVDAEVIGAVLMRENQLPIKARTLTTFDAFQCYARIRMPPPTREPGRNPRDPLLVTRPERNRLDIQIWPIDVGETIRVELTFATPLHGRGAKRVYRDVLGGPEPRTPARERAPGLMVNQRADDPKADWLMQPGDLVLSSVPATGMTFGGEAGGRLHFTGTAAVRLDQPAPTVPFLTTRRGDEAYLVGQNSLAGRIAVFRFDPREYLARKGFVFTDGMALQLIAERGASRRVSLGSFQALDDPRPVTLELVERDATTKEIVFRVRVLGRDGREIVNVQERLPLAEHEQAEEIEDLVGGWHRAQLVHRAYRWAGANAKHQAEALRYAVDLGVLVPGSSAIAIPADERERLGVRLRRLYTSDGVPLGAPRGEADLKQPPRGALDD